MSPVLSQSSIPVTSIHKVEADGVKVFYREAGTPGAPKLVLLHGFPSSSHQYRNLLAALAPRRRDRDGTPPWRRRAPPE